MLNTSPKSLVDSVTRVLEEKLYKWKDLESALKRQYLSHKIGQVADYLSGKSQKPGAHGVANPRKGEFTASDITYALNMVRGIDVTQKVHILAQLGVYESTLEEGVNFKKLSDEDLIAWLEDNWTDDSVSPVFGAQLKNAAAEARRRKLEWNPREGSEIEDDELDEKKMTSAAKRKAKEYRRKNKLKLKKAAKIRARKLKTGALRVNKAKSRAMKRARKKPGFSDDFEWTPYDTEVFAEDLLNIQAAIDQGMAEEEAIQKVIDMIEEEKLDEKVEKIACTECDAVNTKAAWKKNGGFCPSCKKSSSGVAEATDLSESDLNRYAWGDINDALMNSGFGASSIAKILSSLGVRNRVNNKAMSMGNSDQFTWEQINIALMTRGVSPRVIAKVMSGLKGKEKK